jgi:hypothetical protein
MGLPAGLISCPKAKTTQEWLRRNVPAFNSAEDWLSGSPDLNPGDYKLWTVLEDMACQKAQQPGQSEEIPRESSGRDRPGDGVRRDSRVAGASEGLHRDSGRPY